MSEQPRFCDCYHPDCTTCKIEDIRAGELSATKEKLTTAESLINKFEYCIQQVAAELGNPACGGVDADQSEPDSTTSVLVREIRKIAMENAELRKQLALANEYILASS